MCVWRHILLIVLQYSPQYTVTTTLLPLSLQSKASTTLLPLYLQYKAAAILLPLSLHYKAETTLLPLSLQHKAATTLLPLSLQYKAATTLLPYLCNIQPQLYNSIEPRLQFSICAINVFFVPKATFNMFILPPLQLVFSAVWRRYDPVLHHSTDYIFIYFGIIEPIVVSLKWSSVHVYVWGRKQCCKLHYCLWTETPIFYSLRKHTYSNILKILLPKKKKKKKEKKIFR